MIEQIIYGAIGGLVLSYAVYQVGYANGRKKGEMVSFDLIDSLQQRIVKIAYIARKNSLCDAERVSEIRDLTPDPIRSVEGTSENDK